MPMRRAPRAVAKLRPLQVHPLELRPILVVFLPEINPTTHPPRRPNCYVLVFPAHLNKQDGLPLTRLAKFSASVRRQNNLPKLTTARYVNRMQPPIPKRNRQLFCVFVLTRETNVTSLLPIGTDCLTPSPLLYHCACAPITTVANATAPIISFLLILVFIPLQRCPRNYHRTWHFVNAFFRMTANSPPSPACQRPSKNACARFHRRKIGKGKFPANSVRKTSCPLNWKTAGVQLA